MVDREKVLSWLAKNVSNQRLEHILGVEQTCYELALLHKIDANKAACAGLLHDLAKFFSANRLLSLATSAGIEIDAVCRINPHLLHAHVSALIAREEFGVQDLEILEAISNHTLGQPQMSKLSCIVFVADALEPNRGKTEELEAMRLTAKENIYKAVLQTCDYSLRYLLDKNLTIHPLTIQTRNWALQTFKTIKPKLLNETTNTR